MRKIFTLLLTVLLCLSFGSEVLASGPCGSYDPTPFTGGGAWSYIKVTPESGETSRTHYIFSNYINSYGEGKTDKVKGLSYSKKKNTLTIKNYNQEDVILTAQNMGTGFKIKLTGKKNKLRSIKVINDNGWDSGLKITGSGQITIGNKTDHSHVPVDVAGKCNFAAKKIKLIAEKPDVGSGLGLRYTLMVKDKVSKKPFTTKMKYSKKVEINTFEAEAGGALTSSKDTITFTKKK